ncbi:MAG: glycerol-3-phosphate 1-O-acyltransferase PlsY [Clostridia bacterium]|nr:glycerol-3-phosphate 1-O-acyltransferase PlsY [Clostridia bacterium]
MIQALAATEPIEFEKAWNLVDQIIQSTYPNDLGVASVVNIIGALLCMILPYLLGSINPAILISKHMSGEDIRALGNGDAGTDNMLRVYGKGAAIATFACDFGKGMAAVWLGRLVWGINGGALAGFFVLFGHMFPIFHRFKGGKGIACLAAVVLTINPITFVFLTVIFLVGTIGTRMVSFGSVLTALLYPLILNAFANRGLNVAMAVVTAVFVTFMHRENLKRMREGKEEKIDLSAMFGKGKKS